jgi:UDP-2-acetamido-3-amino-2,3-dideoxy-glucuronate N-acetyltransferase
MTVFIHPNALCESDSVGEGTRVWAFAHVLPGAVIGVDCNICDGVFVEGGASVGDRVTVKCGVQLWDGVTLEDDVFVGPNATFTNDRFPRSKVYPQSYDQTLVRAGASIGANATVLPGITIGMQSMVGAGSVVTRDVPEFAIVVGNPARIVGYTNTTPPAEHTQASPDRDDVTSGESGRAGLRRLTRAIDLRGSLVAGETGAEIPFEPKRFFAVYAVPSAETRGSHAHRTCEQFLVCVAGSVTAIVDDGVTRHEYVLDTPDIGLFMPAMTWGTQYRYTPDAVLMVLASHAYDSSDYIRDYNEFLDLVSD